MVCLTSLNALPTTTKENNNIANKRTYKLRTNQYVMITPCPGCCIGPEGEVHGNAGFHQDWTEDAVTPLWVCNNCDHELPRRVRRTKGEMALARLRAWVSNEALS